MENVSESMSWIWFEHRSYKREYGAFFTEKKDQNIYLENNSWAKLQNEIEQSSNLKTILQCNRQEDFLPGL